MPREWWRDAVFYQIYPRSFADSNGDGIGDLDGITAHLDYLNDGTAASLGIDALWLSPINPSPLRDWGYDVSDYCGVHPDLGTLASFDRFIAEAHRRGIRVILDLVPNHTSDQHPWFIESRSSRVNPKRDWYIWRDGRGDSPPTNWKSTFGGTAWKYDDAMRQWYLHSFLEEQPDLNYRNPQVIDAMHSALRFWLDRGVDGFRVDVIAQMIKDAQFRDNPAPPPGVRLTHLERLAYDHRYSSDQPEVHEIIRGFRRVLDEYGDRMMVGEVWPREQRNLADYLRPDECQQAFNFKFLFSPWSADAFAQRIDEIEAMGPEIWPTWTLSNHDFPRHFSRYGQRDADARARLAIVMLLTMRGTPFLYYGEEIGMREVEIPEDRRRDPVGRDGCRTPMQWSAARNGGFTTAPEPWLPAGDYNAINAAAQAAAPESMLSFYRRMIALRKECTALREGSYVRVKDTHDDCLVYRRESPMQRLLIALNFAAEHRTIDTPTGRLLLSTAPDRALIGIRGTLKLAPNEGAIIDLGS